MEKIAIIDLGSNSARLVLVNILEGGYFMVFDELKESVRLGQDMEKDGFLKPTRVAQTIKTLKMFRRLCDANRVDKIFAYATAAVRRAKNQKSFLDEVGVTCGIKLKVLSQDEEAQLVYTGVINSMDVPKGLVVDIGGGSTQLIYYNRKHLLAQVTLPFGAVTLTDLFKNEDLSPEQLFEKINSYVREQIEGIEWLNELDPDTQLIGVGGSFRNLGKISRLLSKYPLDVAHNYHIKTESFHAICDTIKKMELDQTMKIKGLSSGRADIFPSALAAIKAVTDKIPFNEIIISGSGLREGAMFRYAVSTTAERPITDVLGYSLNTLVRYYGENISHVEHVYNLSMQLFKQLKVLHKLPRAYIKVLRVASILHDVGQHIKYYDHHKHSAYTILNSTLYGVSHREIIMASFVAWAHRKNDISNNDLLKFKNVLTEEDVDAVRKLGVILRIAESFDRSMSGMVKGVNCDVLGDSVIMKIETEGDCSLEVKDALSSSVEFKRAYKKNLEIL